VRVGAWQGDQDHVASLELTKRAVDRMPDAQLTVCSGEGHYLGVKWHDEYLEWLVG
jgi:pimeloyl-ACP methyl ester carboxylesterase